MFCTNAVVHKICHRSLNIAHACAQLWSLFVSKYMSNKTPWFINKNINQSYSSPQLNGNVGHLSLSGIWGKTAHLKEGKTAHLTERYAHFNMCIFSLSTDWSWPLRHILYNFAQCCFLFSSLWQNKHVTLGMRLLWKYIRKSKLVNWKYVHFLLYHKKVNLKLKFLGCWEKYELSFDTKKVLLLVELWGMRMQWEHPT